MRKNIGNNKSKSSNGQQLIYEIITNRIIEKLEEGVIPWRKPWINSNAVNWVTQRPYRGINTLLLQAGEYATLRQISEAKGTIKEEERKKGHIIVFWKWIEKEDEETGEKNTIPFIQYSRVWEINTRATRS